MKYLEVFVPAKPVPQARPRFRIVMLPKYAGQIIALAKKLVYDTRYSVKRFQDDLRRYMQVITHDPAECVKCKAIIWEDVMKVADEIAWQSFPSDVAVGATFIFFLSRVENQKNRTILRRGEFPVQCGIGDWDNFGKGPSDALEENVNRKTGEVKRGLYANDSQICDCVVRKRFIESGMEYKAGTLIRLWAIPTTDEYEIPYRMGYDHE